MIIFLSFEDILKKKFVKKDFSKIKHNFNFLASIIQNIPSYHSHFFKNANRELKTNLLFSIVH